MIGGCTSVAVHRSSSCSSVAVSVPLDVPSSGPDTVREIVIDRLICLPACRLPAFVACSCCLCAGLKAELAAIKQVQNQSGEFAAWLSKGSSAVQELQRQVQEAQQAMILHKDSSLKPLIHEVAYLNDCHIVVVSGARVGCGGVSVGQAVACWRERRAAGAVWSSRIRLLSDVPDASCCFRLTLP